MSAITRIDLARLRLPILLFTLFIILYNTVYLVAFVPYQQTTISVTWEPDNVYRVVFALEQESDLQVGDIILAVDGRPARQSAWQPLYSPQRLADTTFIVDRDGQQFTLIRPNIEPGFWQVLSRLKTTAVALITWFMAAPIILLATTQNRRAWQVGIFFIFFAVTISAAEARIINIPGAHLLAAPVPLLAVAFAQLPLIAAGVALRKAAQGLLAFFYLLAGALSLLNLYETLWLFPQGSSFEILTGVSLYALSSLFSGVGLLANLLILVSLTIVMPNSYQRRQVLTILTFTGLAIIPLVFLSALPLALFSLSLLPPWLAFLLLGLIPAGYGFVIYRRQYLELEIFATRTLTILILSLLMLFLYLVTAYIVRVYLAGNELYLLYNLLPFVAAFVVAPIAGQRTHRVVWMLIYGPRATYDDHLARFTAELSADLQQSTLEKVMVAVAGLTQVRQAALLLSNEREQMVAVACLRTGPLPPLSLKTRHLPDSDPLSPAAWQQIVGNTAPLPDWVALATPLMVRESLVGLLLLGLPLPDGYFNAVQVTFIRQVAATLAVASETVRLFESSRMMSRELLRIQDAERAQIASQIHDEPLQQISLVVNSLERLLHQDAAIIPEAAIVIQKQKESLQQIAQQLRAICAGLRPAVLHQGVEWLVREVAYEFKSSTQIEIFLDVDIPDSLCPDEKTLVAVYHIVLEGLNNVHKHARATAVSIMLHYQAEEIVLQIADNGWGSQLPIVSLPELVRRHHFGLVGMMEWASLAGGRLEISQRPEGGTTISLNIPYSTQPPYAP